MKQKKDTIAIEFDRTDAVLKIVPRLPMLSSYNRSWSGITVEHNLQPAHETPEHIISLHSIAINIGRSFRSEQKIDGRWHKHIIQPNQIFITPAHIPHQSNWDKETETIILRLNPEFFTNTIDRSLNLNEIELLPQFARIDPLIQNIGLVLKSELEADKIGDRLYVESAATMLSAHLLRHYCTHKQSISNRTDGLSKQQLKLVQEYIDANLDRDVSIKELADLLQISYFHFARLFKQSTNLTPHKYIVRYRIENAKKLLKNPQLSLVEIAAITGFSDQSHFTRHFKKQVGITPKDFLRQ